MKSKDIRQSFHADSFYPKDLQEITNIVKKFEENVQLPEIHGRIHGAIVPHAGYIYSGYCASHVYKILEKSSNIKNIIMIGPYHSDGSDDIVIPDYQEWETPFGNISTNQSMLKFFIQKFEENNIPHRLEKENMEHSLEVQMPLLKYFLPEVQIIPFLCNNISLYKKMSEIILNAIQSYTNTIFIASSDLSHYHEEKIANDIDGKTINHILNCDESKIIDDVVHHQGACGGVGILSLVGIANQLSLQTQLLNYSTSFNGGEILSLKSPPSRVVGYSSIIFYQGE